MRASSRRSPRRPRPEALIASHNLQFIQERCDRAALIVNGCMAALGPSKEVVRSYEALVMGEEGEQEPSLSSGLP